MNYAGSSWSDRPENHDWDDELVDITSTVPVPSPPHFLRVFRTNTSLGEIESGHCREPVISLSFDSESGATETAAP